MVTRWVPAGLRALRGVEPYEVMQVLSASRRLIVPAESGGIRVLAVLARTLAGRALLVVLRKTGPLDEDIVGARVPRADELAMLEQWEAEHD